MNNKQLFDAISRTFKTYNDRVNFDNEDMEYYQGQLKSGHLNADGLQATRTKIANVQKSLNSHRDKARQEIIEYFNEYIEEHFKPNQIDPSKLDLELVNLLNAGFTLKDEDIRNLWDKYQDYTNRRLIYDYIAREDIEVSNGVRAILIEDMRTDDRENAKKNVEILMDTSIMGNVQHGLNIAIDTSKGLELIADLLNIKDASEV